MKKMNKPLDFVISFEKAAFKSSLKIGNWKCDLDEIDVVKDTSVKDKQAMMKNLIILRAATKSQLDALNERNLLD